MHILVNYAPGHAGPKIMRGFARAFRRLGHTVTDKPSGDPVLPGYDIILGYSGDSVIFMGDSGFTLAHFMNSFLAQYWADDIPDPSKIHRLGLILQSDEGCSQNWNAAGIKNDYLPLAFDDKMFTSISSKKEFDVIMTGVPSKPRIDVLKILDGLNVAIFGPWEGAWGNCAEFHKYYKGCVSSEEELNILYNKSKICVDMSSPQNLNSANFTVFNAMATSCLLATNFKAALEGLFGMDMPPVYRNLPECRELVEKYLSDDALRESEAARQAEVVLNGHTFVHRAEKILSLLRPEHRLSPPRELREKLSPQK